MGMLTVIIRKQALDELDYVFDNDYHIIGDFDIAVRISVYYKFGCVQSPIAYCRWHGNNEQIHQKERHINELQDWMKKMQVYKNISQNPGCQYVNRIILRLKIQYLLTNNRRLDALYHIKQLDNLKDLFQMIIVFLLPKYILLKIKN